jgi:hypothetical protein
MKLIGITKHNNQNIATILEAEISFQRADADQIAAETDERFRASLEAVKKQLKRILSYFDIPQQPESILIEVKDGKKLSSNSFSLSILIELVAKALDIEPDPAIVASGKIGRGPYLPIEEIGNAYLKEQRVHDAHCTFTSPQTGIVSDNFLHAFFLHISNQDFLKMVRMCTNERFKQRMKSEFIRSRIALCFGREGGYAANSNFTEFRNFFYQEYNNKFFDDHHQMELCKQLLYSMKHIEMEQYPEVLQTIFNNKSKLPDEPAEMNQILFRILFSLFDDFDQMEGVNQDRCQQTIRSLEGINGMLKLLDAEINLNSYAANSFFFVDYFKKVYDTVTSILEQIPNGKVDGKTGEDIKLVIHILLQRYNLTRFISVPVEDVDAFRKDFQLEIHINYSREGLDHFQYEGKTPLGNIRSTLQNPKALMDSSWGLPLQFQCNNWSPSLSKMEEMDHHEEIRNLFGEKNLILLPNFNNPGGKKVEILWGDNTGTWPPSIDTLKLIHRLNTIGIYREKYDSILDLGCGTGVHGIMLLRHTGCRKAHFLDIEAGARINTISNMYRNFEEEEKPILYTEGEHIINQGSMEELCYTVSNENPNHLLYRKNKFDLTICTPPYTPYTDIFEDNGIWKAISGTDLLVFTLKNARIFSRKTIIQFSEMALPVVEPYLKGAKLIAEDIVAFRPMPQLYKYFNPKDPINHEKGMHWLSKVEKQLIDVDRKPNLTGDSHGYKYHHKLVTYLIE